MNMITEASKLATASKKKYYEFTYQYTRNNPQLGQYKSTSTVIASTEKEAIKLATKACDNAIYGYNSFDFIISKSEPLVLDKDYSLHIEYKKDRHGYSVGSPFVVAKKIYH